MAPPPVRPQTPVDTPPPPLLRRLIAVGVLPAEDWDALAAADRAAILREPDDDRLTAALAARGLLTDYQAARVRAGRAADLVVGNYRLLDRVGAGRMGTVYRAEHRRLRQPAAVKVLHPRAAESDPRAAARFDVEMRAVARLRHPNVVAAVDAGDDPAAGGDGQPGPYLVMEFVPGADLDRAVREGGPLPVADACHVAHQIADALHEAHRQGLVHRDIKPSNVMVGPDRRAKLLDFGLARLPAGHRLTAPGARLGAAGYAAPEQAADAHAADPRADVYGLGATLYFALTGRDPFPTAAAYGGPPPSLSAARPDLPAELGAVLARMMDPDPARRPPTAEAVMRALLPYLPAAHPPAAVHALRPAADPAARRVLIVDDQPDIRRLCRMALAAEGLVCEEADTGPDAVERASARPFDLVLLDVDLPGFDGEEVLRRLRACPPCPHLKVLMFSGHASGDDLSRLLLGGADDFVTKPFSVVQLRARVKTALRLKEAQDRSAGLSRNLLALNAGLEQALSARDTELLRARSALVLAMAKLVEARSAETGPHLMRLQRYSGVLARAAAAEPAFAAALDGTFVSLLEECAPLHDIGKAGVPDSVLNKPGPLTPDERLVMQAHTVVGSDTLLAVAREHPFAVGFLRMAADIARSHHERWDGTGYPDRLSGEGIPLAARLVAVADVYDALRGKRVYKPGLSHTSAVMTMTEASPGHFDPALMAVFLRVAPEFDRIFREYDEA